MKLAFSTLGCPNWDLNQITDAARRFGYDGIELRAVGGDLDLLSRPEFKTTELARTRCWFEDREISVCCVDTSCNFHSLDANERSKQVDLAIRYSELAAALGAPLIRVFPDKVQPGADRSETRDNIAACLRRIAEQTPEGIRVGLETHGDFANAEAATEILRIAAHPHVALIWDVANSMSAGDLIEDAARIVSPYLAHVHLRDARPNDGFEHWLPVLAGRGNVSFAKTVEALEEIGYDGFISFEWEKFWQPQIEEPEIAFPDFVGAMKSLVKSSKTAGVTTRTFQKVCQEER
jgi:sugar phosphate isomerase/epimerase